MLPVLMLTCLDDMARERAMFHLHLDLPNAVIVRHDIEPIEESAGGIVTRRVSDMTGVVWSDELELEHACLTCATRQDIVPTLQQIIDDGRWEQIILALPQSAHPRQIVEELQRAMERGLEIELCSVIAGIDAPELSNDIFGDTLVAEVGLDLSVTDERSVSEVLCSQLEYADVVVLVPESEPAHVALARALAPEATLVGHLEDLDTLALLDQRHDAAAALRRSNPLTCPAGDTAANHDVHVRVLESSRPFHPDRLRAEMTNLGGGPARSKGCFWLPSRPSMICEWDGSGGQVSIGDYGRWDQHVPQTRLIVTAQTEDELDTAERAFHECLLTDLELKTQSRWLTLDDGFDPWLGVYDVRNVS